MEKIDRGLVQLALDIADEMQDPDFVGVTIDLHITPDTAKALFIYERAEGVEEKELRWNPMALDWTPTTAREEDIPEMFFEIGTPVPVEGLFTDGKSE